jgi:hypothetical protein
VNVIKSRTNLDILEQGHAKDTEDKHDEEKEETNVEQCWEGHHQGKQQSSDSLGTFDQPQDPAYLGHSHLYIIKINKL